MPENKTIRASFIDAAHTIITEEGFTELSARKIAKKAGYSYATIYNHFSDLNEVLLHCKLRYLIDYQSYIESNLVLYNIPLDTFMDLIHHYISYTIKHPNKYLLIHDPKLKSTAKTDTDLSIALEDHQETNIFKKYSLAFLSSSGIIESLHRDIYSIILAYLHGKLSLYLNDNRENESDFREEVQNQLELLLTSFL